MSKTPSAIDPEKKTPMTVSEGSEVRKVREVIATATTIEKMTAAGTGAIPNRIPRAMPASAEGAMASEKKAMERSVTNTPTTAQRNPMASATKSALCMKGYSRKGKRDVSQ